MIKENDFVTVRMTNNENYIGNQNRFTVLGVVVLPDDNKTFIFRVINFEKRFTYLKRGECIRLLNTRTLRRFKRDTIVCPLNPLCCTLKMFK